jgi:hypothetical protein
LTARPAVPPLAMPARLDPSTTARAATPSSPMKAPACPLFSRIERNADEPHGHNRLPERLPAPRTLKKPPKAAYA